MKSLVRKSFLLAIAVFIISCDDEPTNKADLLVGQWNCYESGTEQDGIFPGISTLTIAYEHGLGFSKDGTFNVRYYDFFNEVWSKGTTLGNYEVEDNTILLTYFPGTPDEYKLDLPIVKQDKNHLWFRVALFGQIFEHHLERVNE